MRKEAGKPQGLLEEQDFPGEEEGGQGDHLQVDNTTREEDGGGDSGAAVAD